MRHRTMPRAKRCPQCSSFDCGPLVCRFYGKHNRQDPMDLVLAKVTGEIERDVLEFQRNKGGRS
jgi:hypothetical protein